jgi:DNA-binding IclR family transcriptional regulator
MGKALLAFLEQPEADVYLERTELTPYTANTIIQKDELRRDLEETRQRGYSINREEHLLSRSAVGAPIFERGGRLSASISLVGDPGYILGKHAEGLAKEVMNTALEISRSMGYFEETHAVERMDRRQVSKQNKSIGKRTPNYIERGNVL